MKKRERNAAHFVMLVLMTAFVLLVVNVAVFAGLFARWRESTPLDAQAIMAHLTVDQDGYHLSEEAKERLRQENLFVMILSQEGEILWQEQLPEELNRTYTLQDVASFTRYYLNDYPVHTYIIPEGLLVIGGEKHSVWKYTLEYSMGMVQQLVTQMPIILLINIALLIAVPLFIQRKWLRRREEERTEWIAGVSHDIRTPLTMILAEADAISRVPGDASVSRRAETIRRQGLRIRSLVANLNTSSKLDFGMGDFPKSAVRISSVVRKTVTDYLNREPDDRYTFVLAIPESMQQITVKANEALFQRMLENLINNAIQHNPEGCEIRISLEANDKKQRWCELRVDDNGQGASTETLKALNRSVFTKNDKLRDHGIGLRLVKQIARYHGWKAIFSNREPSGFSIVVLLRKC